MSSNEAETNVGDVGGNAPSTSAGALLREARLAAGVHIESIAFSLKVPVSKIEALENGDLSALPDAVFARALAASVCRALKMDSAPVLALLPQTKAQPLPANQEGVNAAFRDGSEHSGASGLLARLSRPLGVTVVVLLIGAGVLAWMPSEWLEMNFANTPQPTSTVVVPAPNTEPDEQRLGVSVPVQSPDVLAPVETSAPAPLTPPVAPVSSMLTSEPSPAAKPRLQLSARGETWIQVKDTQGAVVLERILRPGEEATVNQPGRLSVVVGRADVTEVRIAGEKLDIASSARENVARFEVKP